MAQFAQTRVALTGWQGSPGYNVLNWQGEGGADPTGSDVVDFHTALQTALDGILPVAWASGVTWTIENEVTVHDVGSGALVGILHDDNVSRTATGTGGGNTSRATQAGIAWGTDALRHGKRLAGHTYLGPIGPQSILDSGQLSPVLIDRMTEQLSAIMDPIGPHVCVWGRPSPTLGAGVIAPVTSVTVRPRPFVLRSRRD